MVATLTNSQVRIATIGSVDDGKSTLIGRLLHDSKGIFEDQLSAVGRASKRYGDGSFNLALLTDGLRAEREQGITIDVAYRYFATPSRSFVLADTPGHAQFTRNMVTGASVSDVAVVLVDARHGVVEQTRRHVAIAVLLNVSHIILAVNKMDLVDWSEDSFDAVVADVLSIISRLGSDRPLHPVPISAVHGDNVVEPSTNMPWYSGSTVLGLLEAVEIAPGGESGAMVPVQWTNRVHGGSDYRAYAGQLNGGTLRVGDPVNVLPSGLSATVRSITVAGEFAVDASPGDAIAVELEEKIDVGRGDVVVHADSRQPVVTREIVSDLCWMGESELVVGSRLVLRHMTREVNAVVEGIISRLDLDRLVEEDSETVKMNDIARVRLSLAAPIVADLYIDNRSAGSIVAIDPVTNATVGALMVREMVTHDAA